MVCYHLLINSNSNNNTITPRLGNNIEIYHQEHNPHPGVVLLSFINITSNTMNYEDNNRYRGTPR